MTWSAALGWGSSGWSSAPWSCGIRRASPRSRSARRPAGSGARCRDRLRSDRRLDGPVDPLELEERCGSPPWPALPGGPGDRRRARRHCSPARTSSWPPASPPRAGFRRSSPGASRRSRTSSTPPGRRGSARRSSAGPSTRGRSSWWRRSECCASAAAQRSSPAWRWGRERSPRGGRGDGRRGVAAHAAGDPLSRRGRRPGGQGGALRRSRRARGSGRAAARYAAAGADEIVFLDITALARARADRRSPGSSGRPSGSSCR